MRADKVTAIGLGVMFLVVLRAGWGEEICFRSVGEAVVRSGVADAGGFRVEQVVADSFGGLGWARVRSCGHPEWPLRVVRTGEGRVAARLRRDDATTKLERAELVVKAGAPVRVVSAGDVVRMEFAGTAVESGAIGQRIRVRLASEGDEKFVRGVVKSVDVLELVR